MNFLCFSTKNQAQGKHVNLLLLCNIMLKILASAVTEAKEMKNIQMGKICQNVSTLHMTCSAIKKLSEIYIKFTKINNTKIVGKKVNAKKI